MGIWNARSFNSKSQEFTKKYLKEEDIDILTIIEYRSNFDFKIIGYNIIKEKSGWNAVIFKEHLELNWNEEESSFTIGEEKFLIRHFKPNNKRWKLEDKAITLGDFNLKTNKHLNKLIIEKRINMFLDEDLQLGAVTDKSIIQNIKIFQNIIDNKTVSDHTLITMEINCNNNKLIINNSKINDSYNDYIYVKNLDTAQKAKSISQKWKASTIVNTLTENTVKEYSTFYKCKEESFGWNTLHLRFWINSNSLNKTNNGNLKGSKAKDAYNKNNKDYINYTIGQLWGYRKLFAARMFFLIKDNKLGATFSNLRPISIIPAWWKILESHLKPLVEDYMEHQVSKSTIQNFGYRKNKGTVEAIVNLREKLIKGNYNTIIHLDIKKAYDSVNITNYIRLRNLHAIEASNKGLVTDICYALTNMGLLINNKILNKTQGLAQGSSLSPFIFIIFFDWLWKEVQKHIENLDINLFVDDSIWLSNEEIESIEIKLKQLNNIFTSYGLTINLNKTIIFNSKWEARQTDFGKVINNNCKILGVSLTLVDGKLTFLKEKLENCKLNKQIYSWSFNERIIMAKTFISSKIIYKWAFSLWDSSTKNKQERKQNEIERYYHRKQNKFQHK